MRCAPTGWHSPTPSSVSGQEAVPGWAWGGTCWGHTDPWAGLASLVGTPSLFSLAGLLCALELACLLSPFPFTESLPSLPSLLEHCGAVPGQAGREPEQPGQLPTAEPG